MSLIRPAGTRPSSWLYRFGWLLFQPYKILIFWPILAISTLLVGLTASVTSYFNGGATLAGRYVAVPWARLNAAAVMMTVEVTGREHIDSNQSYIIVANHQSLADIGIVYGWLGLDFRWVIKQEVRKVPILGFACSQLDHIFIDRSDVKEAMATLNAAQSKISNGTSLFFFPEGTRSKDGQLLRFRKGAFNIAKEWRLPVLPVTILGTCDVAPSGTLDVMPGKTKMVIHPPIPADAYDDLNSRELMKLARDRINSALI